MERRIRDHDWSKNPLGSPEGWPASLKTAVRIMLDSRYPMFVWWGDKLINIYNDAYAPVLGDRHPEALGRPAREIWSEIWDTIGPQSELVMRERRATWNEEFQFVMERNGFPEEAFFTYSYSPIPGDDGGVGGLFCACTEETQRVLGRRRLRLLRALAERAAEAKSIEGACEIAASTLAENPNDIPFALLYLLEPNGTRARLAGSSGLVPSHPASPPTVELGGDGDRWEFARVALTGEAVLVDELAARFGRLPGGVWPESPNHAIVLPMLQGSESARPAGFVVAGISPRLPFHDDYRGFMGLVAGQIGTAVANARAYEEERAPRRSPRPPGRGENRLLLERQPRVPHAADAHARAGRGHPRQASRRGHARDSAATRDRAAKRVEAASSGQHAPRLREDRGGPGPRDLPADAAAAC